MGGDLCSRCDASAAEARSLQLVLHLVKWVCISASVASSMHLMLHTQLVLLVLILSVLHLYRRSASLSRCISAEGSLLCLWCCISAKGAASLSPCISAEGSVLCL